MKKYIKIKAIALLAVLALTANSVYKYMDTPTYNPVWAETFNPNVQKLTTPKGITFWYKKTPTSPSFSMVFMNKYEPDDLTKEYSFIDFNKGETTNFISNMISKGTTTRNADAVREALQKSGMSFNVHVNTLGFIGYINFLSDDAPHLITLLQDMINNPAFEKKYLDIAKKRFDANWQNAENNDWAVISRQAEKNIYKENVSEIGKDSYSHITTADMHALYSKILRKKNIKISVATQLSSEVVATYIDTMFGDLKDEYDTPLMRYYPSVVPMVMQNIETKNKKQTQLNWVSKSFKNTESIELEYNILHTILLSDLSSFLYQRIREEKGLSYNIGMYLSALNTNDDFTVVGSSKVANDKAQEFVDTLHLAFEDIINGDIINKESVYQAKKNMISKIIYSMRTNRSIVSKMHEAQYAEYGVDFVNAYIDAINDISVSDIKNLAKKVLNTQMILTTGNPNIKGIKTVQNPFKDLNK